MHIFWGGHREQELASILSPYIDPVMPVPKKVNLKQIIHGSPYFGLKSFLFLSDVPIESAYTIAAIALSNSACFVEIQHVEYTPLVAMYFYTLSAFRCVLNNKTSPTYFKLLFNCTFNVSSILAFPVETIISVTVSSELVTKFNLRIDETRCAEQEEERIDETGFAKENKTKNQEEIFFVTVSFEGRTKLNLCIDETASTKEEKKNKNQEKDEEEEEQEEKKEEEEEEEEENSYVFV